ncbi:MAG: ABC transporter ATP-binding protein [Solirubrobacteraceae bacterium]
MSANPAIATLSIQALSAGYGGHAVVKDISLSVSAGQIACVVGPNGAGKSTLLRGITGDADFLAGHVWLRGEEISRTPGNQLVRRGLAWVPQLDDVFTTLTVRENLELGGYLLPKRRVPQRVRDVFEMFPLLADLATRIAGRLSGGERKLLAMGRALMPEPSVLLLDEPTAGLSPEMTDLVLKGHIAQLGQSGVAILLVEQRAIEAVSVSSAVHVMVGGELRVSRRAEDITDWDELARLFLGEG